MNLSGNGWGEPDARGQAVRELNRNLDFRKAITYAIDRQRLGNSLVKGPFTAIYPGGLLAGTAFYDEASTVYYPFSVDSAKAELEKAGLKDTDGNGFVNFPAGTAGGKDVEITLLANGDYQTDKSLAEGVVAMMEQLGMRVIVNTCDGQQLTRRANSGKWDWQVRRNESELVSVVQNTAHLAPAGPQTALMHRPARGKIDLLPFEKQLVDIVNKFIATQDADEAQGADEAVPEDLHRERQHRRPDPVSGRADHQQALRQHPAGRADHHVQLGRGQHHPRAHLCRRGQADGDYELHPKTLPGAARRTARVRVNGMTAAARPAAARAGRSLAPQGCPLRLPAPSGEDRPHDPFPARAHPPAIPARV